MTLIAGAVVWNGVLMCSDTRATHKQPNNLYTYSDDILKIDILPAGLGIGVAGDCRTATVFREILIDKFKTNTTTSDTYDGPTQIIKSIIEESLRELAFTEEICKKNPNDTEICGLISSIDTGVNMRLNCNDCKRIVTIQSKNNFKNSVWDKYKDKFIECANGILEFVELMEYRRSILFSFRSKLASGTTGGLLDVEIVPFGKIAAWGSGKSSDHEEQQIITLSYALFGTGPENINDSAWHILRTHGWSEMVVPKDPVCGFRTFGGGYLAGTFIQMQDKPERVEFKVALGDLYRKPKSEDFVCKVFEKDGKLCVKTEENKKWLLTKFWEYQNQVNTSL